MYYVSSPFSSLTLQMTEAHGYYEYYNFNHIIHYILFLILYF